MPRRKALSVTLALLAALAGREGIPAPPGGAAAHPFVPDEVLVAFHVSSPASRRTEALGQIAGTRMRRLRSGVERWRLRPGMPVSQAVEALKRNPNVRYAEPNYIVSIDVTPDDPRFGELWGLTNTGQTGGRSDADIDAEQAWAVSTGSRDIVVAVIDTGVDYRHPDLAANIWTNPGEIAANGIDDDGNGFVDDVHGFDFRNQDGDPMDDNGHGTHCAGTIGAVGNNGIGVTGINWQVRIMALKFLGSGGGGSTSDAVEAIDYAVLMGARLSSNSWGGGGFSQTLYEAIAASEAGDVTFVAAAGNSGRNIDASEFYPAGHDLPGIISVAATTHDDTRAAFSNYGAVGVDLGAPGVGILSTWPANRYISLSGTSMAAPHVAGAAAVILAQKPTLSVEQLKRILLSATDRIDALAGITVSGGRLNLFTAIATEDTTPPDPIRDLAVVRPASNSIEISWTASGDDGGTGRASEYDLRYSTQPIDAANFAQAIPAKPRPIPAPAGTPERAEAGGLATGTTYYVAIDLLDEWGNRSGLSNVVTTTTLPPPTGSVTPGIIEAALLAGDRTSRVVTLRNAGEGALDFQVEDLYEVPSTPGPGAAAFGGPDGFGYYWIDSDDPKGPRFEWTDIASPENAVLWTTGDDDYSPPLPFGFSFPFYGETFSSVAVMTNGFLSFVAANGFAENHPLPHRAAPFLLVAPFWDDLDFHGTPRAYFTQVDGRAVAQWDHVDRFEGGADLTFQAILEPGGAITFQYLSLIGATDSATVGMQNRSKSVGTLIAFNRPYLHDRMAIRIVPVVPWLKVTPSSGRLFAGESAALTAEFDAQGLDGGAYDATLRIRTNDPENPTMTVTARLEVTGIAEVSATPSPLDFSDLMVGLQATRTLRVTNRGSATLHVSGLDSSVPSELTVAPTSFDLPPRASKDVPIRWTPSALGDFSGTITVTSDDPGEPALAVPVIGRGVPEPDLLPSPVAFSETLLTGEAVTRTLEVRNAGGVDLVVEASTDQGVGSGFAGAVAGAGPAAGAGAGAGPGIEGFGGPDRFGYRWRDSDEPGGPVFDWVDIATIGTPVTFPSPDDSVAGPIAMPTPFTFYGQAMSQVWISTNGWISFSAPAGSHLTNLPLPTTSGPRHVIAPLWDDLHRRSGSVRTHFDGTRFIVQYTSVGRVTPSTGVSLTFQILLYPSGRIVCQYRTLTGAPLDSVTVGIQNGARDTGLTAVHNHAGLHDALAIAIERRPDWLSITPPNAVVPPGGSFPFQVRLDATGRDTGLLNGSVILRTNITTQPEVRLPAALAVQGAPRGAIRPGAHDFGDVYTGYPQVAQVLIVNEGTDVLQIDEIVSTDPELRLEEPPAGAPTPMAGPALGPGESRLFDLRWTPLAPRRLEAEIHVVSNDPLAPLRVLPVTGSAQRAPVASWSPGGIELTVPAGGTSTRILRVDNLGGSDLLLDGMFRAAAGEPQPLHEAVETKDGKPDLRPGILGTGGPDRYGYTWRDSGDPDGPSFEWTDISALGVPIAIDASGYCDNCASAPLPIGFAFPYYGARFETVRVSTEGTLSFTSSLASGANQPLPSRGATVPENLLAVLWDDLVLRNGSGPEPRASVLHAWGDGTRFVVQYSHFYRVGSFDDDLTFQVVLHPNGRIVFQYLTLHGNLGQATVGIQNAAKDDGLTVAFNAPYLRESLAVEIRSPFDHLRLRPETAVVAAGGSIDLEIALDAADLEPGDHSAALDLRTNDPERGTITLPIALRVTGIPDIAVATGALEFPATFVGAASERLLAVRNTGNDLLTIGDARVEGDYSLVDPPPPIPIPPQEERSLTLRFTPAAPGSHSGRLVLASDDPDEPELEIALHGAAIAPPVLALSPEGVSTALPPAGNRSKVLTIRNPGASDLEWSAVAIAGSPAWVTIAPGSGTIVAGGSRSVTIGLDATALEDGVHTATIEIASNDPTAALRTVPITLNVGYAPATRVSFQPDTLNLGSHGAGVKVSVELPAGLDPRRVDPCSIRINLTVTIPGCAGGPFAPAIDYVDQWPPGGNGVEEIVLRIDRQALAATIGAGEHATISVSGEVIDRQWWRGTAPIRVQRPGR